MQDRGRTRVTVTTCGGYVLGAVTELQPLTWGAWAGRVGAALGLAVAIGAVLLAVVVVAR